jgi:hypothetical protein
MRMKMRLILLLTMVLLVGVCSIANAADTNQYDDSTFLNADAFDKDKVNSALKNVIFQANEAPKTIVFDDGSSITITFDRDSEGIDESNQVVFSPLIYNGSYSIEYRSEQGGGPVALIYTIHVKWEGHDTLDRADLISHSDSLEEKLIFTAECKGTRGLTTDGTYVLVRGGWEAEWPLIGGHISHTYDLRGYPDGSATLSQVS